MALDVQVSVDDHAEQTMADPEDTSFDPTTAFVHIEDGGLAHRFDVPADFWQDLVSAAPRGAAAHRVADRSGWLMTASRVEHDTTTWEMHPAGDEVLFLVSGKVDVVLEQSDGTERVIELSPQRACVVPRGAWHRQVVHLPGQMLYVTYGKGTQHRPV